MELFTLFPQAIAKVQLEDHKELKKIFADNLITSYKANPDQKMEWAEYCNSWQDKITDSYMEEILAPKLRPHVNAWFSYFNFPDFDYVFSSWFNVHSCDMYQEMHNHMDGPVVICGIYYLQLNDKDNPVVFVPHSDQYQAHLNNIGIRPKHPFFGNYSTNAININEGDLVLFTPDAKHFVPKANKKHDQYRITLSFNIEKT